MKNVVLLGATGSIGDSSLSVLEHHADRFRLVGIAANSNWEKLANIVEKHDVKNVVLSSPDAANQFSAKTGRKAESGTDAMLALCEDPSVDIVINGVVGAAGCLPTLKALENGKKVALANKETMVMAGPLIEKALRTNPKSSILPVDSEHSAIFQCLAGRPEVEVDYLQLTASGGPFRNKSKEEFSKITVEEALNHPTWKMGPKITIDSSTLMNKGLEVIEAHYLFNIPYDQIRVVVHPQSIVHSLVQFRDGSLMAQLGAPDMRVPIQVALSWPERWELPVERVDLASLKTLDFQAPDFEKFRCLQIAYDAGIQGGTAPAILNASNEIAVPAFLDQKIDYTDIPRVIEHCLQNLDFIADPTLNDILESDRLARKEAGKFISELS